MKFEKLSPITLNELQQLENIYTVTESLELAMESGTFEDIKNYFTTMLPSILSDVKEKTRFWFSSSTEFKLSTDGKKLLKKYTEVKKVLPGLQLELYGDKMVSVPENFEGNLKEYLNYMLSSYRDLKKIENAVLNKFNLIINNIVNNKESLTSFQDNTKFFNELKLEREKIVEGLKPFFPRDLGKDRGRLNKVISRWGDLDSLTNDTATLITEISNTDINHIKSSVDKAVKSLDMILSKLKKDPNYTEMSAVAAKNISESTYEVAKYLELFGVIYHQSRVAIFTVDKILDSILGNK